MWLSVKSNVAQSGFFYPKKHQNSSSKLINLKLTNVYTYSPLANDRGTYIFCMGNIPLSLTTLSCWTCEAFSKKPPRIANPTNVSRLPTNVLKLCFPLFISAKCPTGMFFNSARDCQPCARGKYQDVQGQLSCKDCPQGTSSVAGANSASQCKGLEIYYFLQRSKLSD